MKWRRQEAERPRVEPGESGDSTGSQVMSSRGDTFQPYLREKFQTYCSINRNVASNAKADEGCENENSIVGWRRCEAQPENWRDQHCQVEGVLAAWQRKLMKVPKKF